MFIKKIRIQGFKTYKNTTEIDALSPHFNVVVGRNGSGKSNFFSAIRFVLSDAYTHMTREERQGLIHEGSGTVMSAYVEVVFSNEDRRFPIQKDEFAVRRTIGLKKDDYSMDGRSATRSDVMNLLESAGFSRSNPYYIVPQGRITALTNSSDAERLQLLKEVSGARMFESRLKESNKEMAASSYKMDRIDESMAKLQQKLADLQLESENLREYQHLEKSRKVYEFNILDRELKALAAHVDARDAEYDAIVASSRDDISDLERRERACQDLQSTIDDVRSSLKVATLEREQCLSDFTKARDTLATKQALVAEGTKLQGTANELAEYEAARVAKCESLIKANTQTLADVYAAKQEELKKKELQVKRKTLDLVAEQRRLFSKRSRFSQFASKAQRDEWLQNEIASMNEALSARQAEAAKTHSELRSAQESLLECQTRLDDIKASLADPNRQRQISELADDVKLSKLKVQSLIDEKRQLWREEIKLTSLRDSAEHELTTIGQNVAKTMNRSQANALKAVADITGKFGLQDSVHGPLVDLFTVSDKYKSAVEVVGGSSLFHVVVDTDETASILMQELIRSKAGRITIIPLNRLEDTETEFPEDEEQDFIPLIKKIKYDAVAAKAIQQVFGKTIICNNLQRGSVLARKYKLNAVTLDGDVASTKGVLSGGFREFKTSCLDNLKLQSKKRKELAKVVEKLKRCTADLREMDAAIDESTAILQAQSQALEDLKRAEDTLDLQRARILNDKFSCEKKVDSLEAIVEAASSTIKNTTAKISQFESELESDFTRSLSESEERRLVELNGQIADADAEYNDMINQLAELETAIAGFENENSNLRAQIKQVTDSSEIDKARAKSYELDMISEEISLLSKQVKPLEKKLKTSESKEASLNEKLKVAQGKLDAANKQQLALLQKIDNVSKTIEKVLAKKAILDNRREELQEKIRELGVLPEEAFQSATFENMTSNQIFEMLNSINVELKKYAHINKKAMEQFNNFAREKEELVARKEELELSRESIENLVHSLELQKDSAIQRSFEQVSRSFSEIFEKLVPQGKAQLSMRSAEAAPSEGRASALENYVGVSILVSFNSKDDDQQYIEQLSGGQKSLCAITLILAIQKCDPAPFYLFDEIDANLDTQYRTAVASMIQSLSASAQFICTTFRPEMLQMANTFYGVSFADKVSTVSEIVQGDALSFVEAQK